MPVLGDAGGVSSILNCIVKLASVTSTTDICSRSVLRAAELDPRGHKRDVDAHHLLCLAVAMAHDSTALMMDTCGVRNVSLNVLV